MKTTLIVMLFLQAGFAFAQISATKDIKNKISNEFNEWLAKSQFETNAEYEIRIKNQSDETLKSITDKILLKLWPEEYPECSWGKLGDYDAENETFLVKIFVRSPHNATLINSTKVSHIIIKISRNIASGISNKFISEQYACDYCITILPNKFSIINDKWEFVDAMLIFYNGDIGGRACYPNDSPQTFKITKDKNGDITGELPDSDICPFISGKFKIKEIFTSTNILPPDNFFYYQWKLSDQPDFNPSTMKPISFTLEDLNITLPTISTNPQTSSNTNPQAPDLDMNSIQTKNKNSNAFAVIIGNKDYQYTKKVSFSINDAQTIKKYLINVLGYNEGNIFYLENAGKSNFETYFGTKENPHGKLYNNIKQGISDVFIYYSGHGAPGLKDNKGYFVPIDCDPQYVEQGGYSLDLFYNNISKLNAKSITVVTDACFSGAEIFNNISPIIITVPNLIAVADNCVVLSSSTGSQVSSWYNDKQHGMFTYFFLKALQDKDKSDKNKDGKLSYKEIFEYVSDKTEGVPYYARSIHGVDQTPTIQGAGVENIFIEYK